MMDLGRLRALHAVATHGSIGAAATALGYTPSAISQQLAKLERETRTTLLERRGRGVVLTDAAGLLAETAGRVLALVEEAEVDLEAKRGAPVGVLRVAAFATASRGLLPGVLAGLAASHPGLVVRLLEIDPSVSVDLVARGEVDLAVVHDWHNTRLPIPDGLARAWIGDDGADILLPADHPLADRSVLVAADLAGERWICQQPGTICHDWLVQTLRDAEIEPNVVYEATEYQTQQALIGAGLGIGLLPRLGRGPASDRIVVRPLEPVPTRRLFAIWREQATRRPAITVTVAALQAGWADRDTAPPPA